MTLLLLSHLYRYSADWESKGRKAGQTAAESEPLILIRAILGTRKISTVVCHVGYCRLPPLTPTQVNAKEQNRFLMVGGGDESKRGVVSHAIAYYGECL